MAGLNLLSVQDLIVQHVRTQFNSYEVYEDYILDEQELSKVSRTIKPYIVISWDGLNRSPANASFAGVRHDEYYSGFAIGIIAPTPSQCRRGMNILVDNLVGWSYDGVGVLTPTNSTGAFVVAENDGVPHMYMAMAEFTFPMNSDDPGAYITP